MLYCRVNKEFYAHWKEKALTVGTTAVMAVIHNNKITVANGQFAYTNLNINDTFINALYYDGDTIYFCVV